MGNYQRRIVDATLDELQPHLRALFIHGPKGVGKTATAVQRAASVIDLSLLRQRELVTAAPEVLTDLPGPVLVDEWQRPPRSGITFGVRSTPDQARGISFLLAARHPEGL